MSADWGHGDGHLPDDFLRITPLDRPKRRALWVRCPPCVESDGYLTPDGSEIEIRAGREGDDARLHLKVGDVVTREHIVSLYDCLTSARFALEDWEDVINAHRPKDPTP